MNQYQQAQSEQIGKLLTLLANQYCRAILLYFQGSQEDVATIQDLAKEIRKEDHEGTKQVVLRLHHSIIPRLAETEVLDYDSRSQTIQYHGHSELEKLMNTILECFPKSGQ